jgi:dienelactone hydrolase
MAGFASREQLIAGLREVQFVHDVAGESVPGLLCLPAGADTPVPLVLIQHPGMSSKDDYFVREVAMDWAKRGWACGGIDAPLHGERAVHDPMRLFREPDRYPEVRTQFAREISATIDVLASEFSLDLSRLGFVGYSLGSMLGIAAIARDGRFKAAVLGLVGEGGLAGSATGPDSDIAKLGHVAVRVIGKANDQIISREATDALYAALPGEKDITWLPGGHFEIGPDVVQAASDWMKAKL